jgi:hypothetical protein
MSTAYITDNRKTFEEAYPDADERLDLERRADLIDELKGAFRRAIGDFASGNGLADGLTYDQYLSPISYEVDQALRDLADDIRELGGWLKPERQKRREELRAHSEAWLSKRKSEPADV